MLYRPGSTLPYPARLEVASKGDGNLSPTKRKRIENLTAMTSVQPQLFIMGTLVNISIITSERDLGTDAYLQPAFADIEHNSD
jgi:hypothetical protein